MHKVQLFLSALLCCQRPDADEVYLLEEQQNASRSTANLNGGVRFEKHLLNSKFLMCGADKTGAQSADAFADKVISYPHSLPFAPRDLEPIAKLLKNPPEKVEVVQQFQMASLDERSADGADMLQRCLVSTWKALERPATTGGGDEEYELALQGYSYYDIPRSVGDLPTAAGPQSPPAAGSRWGFDRSPSVRTRTSWVADPADCDLPKSPPPARLSDAVYSGPPSSPSSPSQPLSSPVRISSLPLQLTQRPPERLRTSSLSSSSNASGSPQSPGFGRLSCGNSNTSGSPQSPGFGRLSRGNSNTSVSPQSPGLPWRRRDSSNDVCFPTGPSLVPTFGLQLNPPEQPLSDAMAGFAPLPRQEPPLPVQLFVGISYSGDQRAKHQEQVKDTAERFLNVPEVSAALNAPYDRDRRFLMQLYLVPYRKLLLFMLLVRPKTPADQGGYQPEPGEVDPGTVVSTARPPLPGQPETADEQEHFEVPTWHNVDIA